MILKNKIMCHKGFTLIELMIVIAIIGIMATIIVPMVTTVIPRYYSRAEARELMIQFKKAKLEAVKRNREVCINFINVGTSDGQYIIFVNVDRDSDIPRTLNEGKGDVILVDKTLQANIQFISTIFTNNQAGYNSRGLPLQASNQYIELGSGNTGSRTYTLTVSQTGDVRIK